MPEKINVMNPLQIYQNMYTKEFFLVILFLSTKILGQGGILLYETIMCLVLPVCSLRAKNKNNNMNYYRKFL